MSLKTDIMKPSVDHLAALGPLSLHREDTRTPDTRKGSDETRWHDEKHSRLLTSVRNSFGNKKSDLVVKL